MNKLNIGCGTDIREDYINLEIVGLNGVDVVHNLSEFPYPFKSNYFDEILCQSVLELIDANFIQIMEELYRISKNECVIEIISPAFPNMNSAQDPLTRKFMTWTTFDYFGENSYWYYSKARFRTIEKKYIYSYNKKLMWISFFLNLFSYFLFIFIFLLCLHLSEQVI